MTSEALRFFENARDHLRRAETMLNAGLEYDAGRAAYLAAFHAAQALIFEREGKIIKTHKGVNIEFLRLTKDDSSFPRDLRSFLSKAYDFKAVADYDTGFMAAVSSEEAREAVDCAHRFVETVRSVLLEPDAGQGAN